MGMRDEADFASRERDGVRETRISDPTLPSGEGRGEEARISLTPS